MRKLILLVLPVVITLFVACRPPAENEEISNADYKKYDIIIEKEFSGQVFQRNLNRPFGLVKGTDDFIYLTDKNNNRIIRFTKNLKPKKEIGGFGSESGSFGNPSYMAFDNNLSLVVADDLNRRLVRFNSYMAFVEEIIFEDEENPLLFGTPSGVGFTNYGEMWVTDRENDQVAVYNNIGKFDRMLGEYGYAGGQLSSPEKIVKDDKGNFIICDAGNKRLIVYDNYGNFKSEIVSDYFEYPISACQSDEIMWVLDRDNNQIHMLDNKGRYLFSYGPVVIGSTIPLKEPSDIISADSEHLLVADTGNDRLLLCRIIPIDEE